VGGELGNWRGDGQAQVKNEGGGERDAGTAWAMYAGRDAACNRRAGFAFVCPVSVIDEKSHRVVEPRLQPRNGSLRM